MEQGIEIESTIRNKPVELSLRGKIVDVKSTKASDILSKLKELQKKGSIVKYVGRNSVTNLQIQSFNTSHPYTNAGGADFDMTLKEVRIAKSAYNKKSEKKKQETKKNNPDLSVGSIVVFKGGSVYVSSDATKAAANRGRSTCKITIINKRSWSKHSYHLISTDGGRVYGWVDKSNIEGVPSSNTAAKTNGGTQQVRKTQQVNKSSDSKDKTYYTVKKGDTVFKLANTTFKDKGISASDIMSANPYAFSEKGNASTLIVGARIYIPEKTKVAASSGAGRYSTKTVTHGGSSGKF